MAFSSPRKLATRNSRPTDQPTDRLRRKHAERAGGRSRGPTSQRGAQSGSTSRACLVRARSSSRLDPPLRRRSALLASSGLCRLPLAPGTLSAFFFFFLFPPALFFLLLLPPVLFFSHVPSTLSLYPPRACLAPLLGSCVVTLCCAASSDAQEAREEGAIVDLCDEESMRSPPRSTRGSAPAHVPGRQTLENQSDRPPGAAKRPERRRPVAGGGPGSPFRLLHGSPGPSARGAGGAGAHPSHRARARARALAPSSVLISAQTPLARVVVARRCEPVDSMADSVRDSLAARKRRREPPKRAFVDAG